jgi:uncharacterized membrane protein YtjA (UPF0391 family)
MTRAAISFFALAIISVLIGAYGLMGVSIQVSKALAMIFVALAILSFAGGKMTSRKGQLR